MSGFSSMSGQVPDAFRAHFLQHNRRVLGVAALMLGASLLLWALLYFLFYWAALFLITLVQGVEATPPAGFFPRFAAISGLLCGFSLLRKTLFPYPRIGDRKGPFATALDVIFALPNMSVSAVQTLAAFRALKEEELLSAWHLLRKIVKEGSITIQQLPLEIPREGTRRKVMMALQLTGLIELHGSEGELGFRVANETGQRLGQEHVRIV